MFFFHKIVVFLVRGKKVQFVKLKRLKPATHNPRDVGVFVLHKNGKVRSPAGSLANQRCTVQYLQLQHQQLRKISAMALEGLGRPTSPPRTPDPRTAVEPTGHSLQGPPSCGNESPDRMLEPIRPAD
jgi:hypothetical protein